MKKYLKILLLLKIALRMLYKRDTTMKIVIIGAQAAGMTCSMRLKRNLPQADIIVFEKSDYISFGACGLPYFIAEEFSDESYMFAKTKEKLSLLSGTYYSSKYSYFQTWVSTSNVKESLIISFIT